MAWIYIDRNDDLTKAYIDLTQPGPTWNPTTSIRILVSVSECSRLNEFGQGLVWDNLFTC